MVLHCSHCSQEVEFAGDLSDGQPFRCPHCRGKTIYRRPTRIALPQEAQRPGARPRQDDQPDGAIQPTENHSSPANRLHVIRDHVLPLSANPADERKLTVAENNVRIHLERQKSDKRQKKIKTLITAIVVLLMAVFGMLVYVRIQHRQEEEVRFRIELEAEREQRRLARERAEQEVRTRQEAEAPASRKHEKSASENRK